MQVSEFRIYFLEPGYFFSKILSEFRKKIVALQQHTSIRNAITYETALTEMIPAKMISKTSCRTIQR